MDNAIGLGIILSLRDRASAGLDAVRNKLTALRDVSDKMMKRFDEGAKQMVAGFASMAVGAKVIGVMNNMFGSSVNTAADFEQAMARVGAVSGAVGKDFEALTKQARDLGRDTQYSATQVANSQELLARAGFQTNEIISAMPGLLNMTAAEGMDLATGADIAASALRGFGMSADEMNRVADVLAKTSSASNTSISLLGESLKYVAKPAAALGFTIEQTNAMLGAMANSGIKGSQAGTALRAAFLRLSKEPKAVANALAELGVSSKTTEGNLRPLPELMLDLSKKLAGMGTGDKMKYLANIFGSEAATGMLAVMEAAMDTSDKGLAALERALYGCSGAAKQMADRMNATAQGAMKRLESASEGMRIAIGNHLLPVYTKAIDLMAQFKSWLTQLIEEHPIISKAVIGFTAAILGLSGTALILVGAMASVDGMIKMWPLLRKMAVYALTSIKAQARMALTSLSGLSVPVIGMIALAGALYYAWRKNLWGIRDMVTAVTEGFRMAWSASTDGIAEIDDALAKKLKAAGILDYAIIVGQVFFRIRKFISGFIEGLKDTYNFVVGIFDWLKGIFSPVIESGQELLKFLGILKPVAKTQTDTWRAWGQLLGRFAPAVIGVITAFKGMRIIKGIFWDLGKAILGMFSLITAHPIIALITIIAGLAVYAYNHWDEITAYVSEKWQKITGLCAKAADWVKRKWQALKNWWNSWTLKDIFAPLIDCAVSVWNFVKRKWNDFLEWWDGLGLSCIFAPVKDFALDAWNYVKGKWTEFCAWWDGLSLWDLFTPIKEFAGLAKDYAVQKWEELCTWWNSLSLSDFFAPVKDFAVGAYDYVRGKWQEFKDWWNSWKLTDIFPDSFSLPFSWDDIKPEDMSAIWDGVLSGWENAKSAIISGWQSLTGILTTENLAIAWEVVSNGFGTAKDLVISGWESLKGIFSNIDFGGIWDSLASGFATVCDSIKGAWEGVTGFIKDAWDTASDYVSGAWKWTKGLFGFDTDAEDLQKQVQDINTLNKMSETFAQRVAEMTQAWQPFKLSLGEGFTQIYTTMQGVADRIRGTVIPAVNELASALSRVASEISAVAQASNLSVSMKALNPGTVGNVSMQYQQTVGGVRKRAEGGIITRPEFAFIGEAGREAVIPLEDRAKGLSLWLEAGRELGMLPVSTITNQREIFDSLIHNSAERSIIRSMAENSVLHEISDRIIPHATGGNFSQPHIGLVAEAGREAIIPLERQSQGTQLWFQAGRELGLLPERKTSSSVNTFTSAMMNVINPESFNSTYNNARSYSSIMNTLKYPAEAISMKPEITNSLNKTQNISKSYAGNMILMNKVSPESVSNVATMNTQRISQVYDSITRIANAMKLQSKNIRINRNAEGISRMQKRNIFQYYSIKNAFPLLQTREITNNFAGMNAPVIPHAMGGIFSSPHIGLIAEAGREAVIPLDDRSRGIPLLMAAANEIGGADFITNQPYSMPMLIQQTQNQTAFQTADRQPDTRGNIAVNVDVKPADVYIDGERIGRISFRWSERQTIRNGIDS